MKFGLATATLVMAVAGMYATPAMAADEAMEMSANAAANCQGALPSFEGAIRKRPLAVQNEGTSNSFVTCAFVNEYDVDDIRAVDYFGVFLVNNGATDATVNCTGVAGFDTNDTNVFISKSVVVPANRADQALMVFVPADNGGNSFYPLVAVSCNLPAGVGINDTYVGYVVNDGNA